MGRGKKCRRAKLKKIRSDKKKAGKKVPFDLQNCPKRLSGTKNRYCYKTNVHNLIYKGAHFFNVKYQASNITKCNFKMGHMENVDFVACNLKESNFSNAKLKNVTFFNCNLRGTIFTNCKFENVFFMATSSKDVINMPNDGGKIICKYPDIDIASIPYLLNALKRLTEIPMAYDYHVLSVSPNKPNLWNISILKDLYGDKVGGALLKFSQGPKICDFYTLGSYINFLDRYFKMC